MYSHIYIYIYIYIYVCVKVISVKFIKVPGWDERTQLNKP